MEVPRTDAMPKTLAKGLFLAFVVIVTLVLVAWTQIPRVPTGGQAPLATEKIMIGNVPLTVEIADTDVTRVSGLSGRSRLVDGTGMLFDFGAGGFPMMWMKDMKFSLDMLWIGPDKTVVDIKENLSPDTYPKIFSAKEAAQYVLEVPAGFVSAHGIKTGDRMRILSNSTGAI